MQKLTKDLIKYTPREEQRQAIEFIAKTIHEDPSKRIFLMDMPTGVGKSLFAMYICQWFLDNINKNYKFDILTCQKVLQKQYIDDFQSITNLWGADNYQCKSYHTTCKSGREFNRLNKTKCDNCPYEKARDSFVFDKISMTNFHLYTLYNLFRPDLLESRNSNVLIVDESHDIETIFSDFISIVINDYSLKKLHLKNEDKIISSLNRINNILDFVSYIRDFLIGETADTITYIKNGMKKMDPKKVNRNIRIEGILKTGEDKTHKKDIDAVNELETFKAKLENFLSEYEKSPENWVIEINQNKRGINNITVEPIWVQDQLNKYLWSKYDYVILMSGTILDKNMFNYINGIDGSKSVYYSIPSPFSIKNRPIYYMPVGKMSWKEKSETWNKYIPWINKLMSKYQNDKGIIHTNSFELVNWVKRDIKSKRILFHLPENDKDQVLRTHYLSGEPTVLCSPSMTTGIDLSDERARFQIMLKVPYPSLASQKNKMRLKQHSDWYGYRTVQTIIQMYGRGVRNENDHAHFIILDGSFKDILDYSGKFIPSYIKTAIKKVDLSKVKK
jgi:Rad3-related DNA helicase